MTDWHVPHPTRRSVLRAGGTAAWAVPVVAVVAAAPAYAEDSGLVPGSFVLATTAAIAQTADNTWVDHDGMVVNNAMGRSEAHGRLQVAATIANPGGAWIGGGVAPPGSTPIAGWSYLANEGMGGGTATVTMSWRLDVVISGSLRVPPVRYEANTRMPFGTIRSELQLDGGPLLISTARFGTPPDDA